MVKKLNALIDSVITPFVKSKKKSADRAYNFLMPHCINRIEEYVRQEVIIYSMRLIKLYHPFHQKIFR